MIVVEVFLALIGAYVAVWALYVLAIPVMASLRPQRPPRRYRDSTAELPTVAVIVPSHNMKEFVVRCIDSLLACDYPPDRVKVYVVADHCTDDTAALSVDAGATVLVREEGPRGKTYTLAWAIETLTQRGVCPDLYVIVDATARVDGAFLKALAARWVEGEDIVISRAVLDTANRQWFAQCLGLTLAHRNLQNWARERLGLSAFISGRGMGYSSRYIQKYGWRLALPNSTSLGAHPTEDWRHGVRIAEEGLRAAFASEARVFTPLRGSLSAATEQGVRWERGRIKNAGTLGRRLLGHGLRERDWRKVLAALDAVQPPVAILAGLTVIVAISLIAIQGSRLSITLGVTPLFLVAMYGLAVIETGRREGISLKSVVWAPIYLLWRCMAFVVAWMNLDRFGRHSNRASAGAEPPLSPPD
jgi:cellulose synthase/poly-beta-1,6-N-acetylglucosamine synthase-like glycosyltransferase